MIGPNPVRVIYQMLAYKRRETFLLVLDKFKPFSQISPITMRYLIIFLLALSAIADVGPDLQRLSTADESADLVDYSNPNVESPIDLNKIASSPDDSQSINADPSNLNVNVSQLECDDTVDQVENPLNPSVKTRRSRRKRGAFCRVQEAPSREKTPAPNESPNPSVNSIQPPSSAPGNPCGKNDRWLSCAGPEGFYLNFLAVADCIEGSANLQPSSF